MEKFISLSRTGASPKTNSTSGLFLISSSLSTMLKKISFTFTPTAANPTKVSAVKEMISPIAAPLSSADLFKVSEFSAAKSANWDNISKASDRPTEKASPKAVPISKITSLLSSKDFLTSANPVCKVSKIGLPNALLN